MKETCYIIIHGSLYKLGQDGVLFQCVLPHECQLIIDEAHVGTIRGHFQVDTTIKKILQAGLWWQTLNRDCKSYLLKCDKCQRMGRTLKKNEMPLIYVSPRLRIEIWAIDFVGPFLRPGYRTCATCIIIVVEYITKWEEVKPIESCTKEVAAKFIYENMMTRFGCHITLISDRGTRFINQTIEILMKEYMIDHHKR